MAADVSSMVNSDSGNSEISITRDFLGGLSNTTGKKDLDISLDLKRCDLQNSPLSSFNKHKMIEAEEKEISNSNSPPWNFMEESSLDLKLVPSSSRHCQSVCTLDKVRSALQRTAQKNIIINKTLLSHIDGDINDEKKSISNNNGMFAAGCPGCLMYVITFKRNPICPRCNSIVPSPTSIKSKKPRIDLNQSF